MRFRNLRVTPEAPVEQWTSEGILTAIERGSLSDWRRVAAAVRRIPEGAVAQSLAEALEITESTGVASAMGRILEDAKLTESDRVSRRIRELVRRSGLSQTEFATHLHTSQSRLSTYMSGSVTPSAVIMARIERIAQSSR